MSYAGERGAAAIERKKERKKSGKDVVGDWVLVFTSFVASSARTTQLIAIVVAVLLEGWSGGQVGFLCCLLGALLLLFFFSFLSECIGLRRAVVLLFVLLVLSGREELRPPVLFVVARWD